MPTTNVKVTSAWTKLASSGDSNLLVTWEDPTPLEVATTSADVAPAVKGHRLSREDAVTRSVIGPGYVWARLLGKEPIELTMVVTK